MGGQIGALGLWGALRAAFGDIHALILATVNFGGVFVAFLLAFFSHDPDKDFDAAAVALEKNRTAVERLQAEYQKRRKKVIGHFKPDLTAISADHGRANRTVYEFKARLGVAIDDDDRVVIDELDTLAEDSEHAEETGAAERPAEPDGSVRRFCAEGIVRSRPVRGLLAAAIAAWLLPSPASATTEDHRYCSDSASNVVFYLDVTTPYDTADEEALVSGISRIFDSLEDGGRISIRTIEEAFSSSDRLLDMCVPYCESGGFLADLFSDCTQGVVINEKKRLRAAVRETLGARLRAASELPNSEIVRTIAMSAQEEFRPGRPNRIYIFSDMIENSAYLGGGTFFSSATTPLMEKIAADGLVPSLSGASVRVFGVGRNGISGSRDPLPQERLERLMAFWGAYFNAAGASLTVSQNLSSAD